MGTAESSLYLLGPKPGLNNSGVLQEWIYISVVPGCQERSRHQKVMLRPVHIDLGILHERGDNPIRIRMQDGAAVLLNQVVGRQAVATVTDIVVIDAAYVCDKSFAAIFANQFFFLRQTRQFISAYKAPCSVTHESVLFPLIE
jgi:hypothetical protein